MEQIACRALAKALNLTSPDLINTNGKLTVAFKNRVKEKLCENHNDTVMSEEDEGVLVGAASQRCFRRTK